jgi:hypothetical protein
MASVLKNAPTFLVLRILVHFAKQPPAIVFKPLLAVNPSPALGTSVHVKAVGVVEALCPIPARGLTRAWRATIVWMVLPGLFA